MSKHNFVKWEDLFDGDKNIEARKTATVDHCQAKYELDLIRESK